MAVIFAHYAADIVENHITTLKKQKAKQAKQSWGYLNRVIIQLLPALPEERAEQLFGSFELNDPLPYQNPNNEYDHSGYKPVYFLFRDKQIDETWKKRVGANMHTIIRDEMNGKEPRRPWEGALERYTYIIDGLVFPRYSPLPVSPAFFEEEVTYLIDKSPRPIFMPVNLESALDEIENPQLRRSLLYHQLKEPSGFDVYDWHTLKFAEKVVKEYSSDRYIRDSVKLKIAEYKVEESRAEAQESSQIARESTLLFQMTL